MYTDLFILYVFYPPLPLTRVSKFFRLYFWSSIFSLPSADVTGQQIRDRVAAGGKVRGKTAYWHTKGAEASQNPSEVPRGKSRANQRVIFPARYTATLLFPSPQTLTNCHKTVRT